MPWTDAIFVRDDDKPGVGTITAIWNKGLVDEFTFTQRVDSSKDGAAFVAAAKAAQAANATKRAKESSVSTAILAALNT